MAKTRTSPITLRFVFNRNTGTVQPKRWNAASRFIARDIAMNISDENWKIMRSRIAGQVMTDINREMSHLAQEYLRLVVGISGNNEGPQGELKTQAEPAEGITNFSRYRMHIAWDERSRDYLRRKQREKGHTHWFEHDRVLARSMGKASTWFGAYGPVGVQVIRKAQSLTQEQAGKAGFQGRFGVGSSSARVQIGTIRVFAMRGITPQMLPALASGRIDDWAPDGATTGLISRFPRDIQHGLAPNRRFVPYRHSVEPFLAFFLTRAIPNAVLRRLQEGMGADIGRIGV